MAGKIIVAGHICLDITPVFPAGNPQPLGKLLSLIPYLQTMFPEEKIINVSETEKKLTTPEELAFINRRLELVRNGEIR